ncbi:hypothetical protein ACFL4L_03560 [bacterium]
MDLSDYFKIISSDDHVLHIQIQGFWSDEFAIQYGAEFLNIFKSAIDQFQGRQFIILTEESGFKVPTEGARQLLVVSMQYCKNRNMYLAIDLNPSSLGNLGLGRIVKEAHMQDNRVIMKSLQEAQQFIESCRNKLQ